MLQKLENRVMCDVKLDGTDLIITQTGQSNDVIYVQQVNSTVKVTINNLVQPDFDVNSLFTVVIHAGAGKDHIYVDKSFQRGALIFGEGGDDFIECRAQQNSIVDGGSGIDTFTFASASNGCQVTLDNLENDGIFGTAGVYNLHSNIEVIVGTSHADNIYAAQITNATIYGGAGDDTITGGLNGDVSGGEGDDLFLATDSTGSNRFFGQKGNDSISYVGRTKALNLSLDGTNNDGESNELDSISSDIEEVVGGLGNDKLTGNDSANLLNGFGGNDSLIGGGGNDSLYGSFGKDTLNGGTGDDLIDGGSGSGDLVTYVDRTKNLTVDLSGKLESGEAPEKDKIFNCEKAVGGSGDDEFYGNDADNLFSGQNGNDRFSDSKGNDTYWGGDGKDTASYLLRNVSGVTASLDGVANDGAAGEKDNVSTDIERLEGSKGNDLLIGNSKDNILLGRQGNDTLQGLGGDDTLDDVDNSAGADVYEGGSGKDTVGAYASHELGVTITTNDNLANDGPANENDNVKDDVEVLIGSLGPDIMTGSTLHGTWFYGGKGDDTFFGGNGDDQFIGQDGSDTVDYSSRTDHLTLNISGLENSGGNGEQDLIDTTIERLISGSGNDTITGSDNADYIEGGKGADSISGGKGNDTLRGGDDKDTLIGGAGKDKLYGDGGNDKFKAQDGEKDTLKGGSGTDSVLDKDGSDVLESVP